MLSVTSHATITGVDGYIANWREAQADAAREPEVVAVVPFVESRGLLAQWRARGRRHGARRASGRRGEGGGPGRAHARGHLRISASREVPDHPGQCARAGTRRRGGRQGGAHGARRQRDAGRIPAAHEALHGERHLRFRHVRVRPRPCAHAHEGCRHAVPARRSRHGPAARAQGSLSGAAGGAHRGARHRLRRQGLFRERLDPRPYEFLPHRSSSRSR